LHDLSVERTVDSPAGVHVRFAQIYEGIPVYGGGVTVSIPFVDSCQENNQRSPFDGQFCCVP
ncbi:MAG: hypothetical protein HY961_08690, partial [Ignavibacteriae bacterium]|nr:hypothetical protein [Ignavibacteriota bacterium]